MNGPIASKRLAPAAAELVERVPFFPDETTFNYVNRIACLTAAINRRQVAAMLFGSPTIRTERPLHCGFGHLAALHADAYGASPTDFPQRFGMLALYAPFVDAERYRRALNFVHGTRLNGANEIVGLRSFGVFRDTPAFCPGCLEDDLADGRPAYFRRVHQVLAVTRCQTHGVPLIAMCHSCGSGLSHEQQPRLYCRHCGASLEHDESFPELGSRAALLWRLAKFIQAATRGDFPNVDAKIRIWVLRERVARDVKSRSGTVGDNLARALIEGYGRLFLSSLGLSPDSSPTLAWPALFLEGRRFVSEPIANCLVMAMLFDSIEDYAGEVADAVRRGKQQTIGRNSLFSATRMTIGVLKDLLRPLSVEEVAKKHSIDLDDLKKWVAAVPGFSKRRLVSGARVKLRACKETILQHLERHSSQSRASVAVEHNRELGVVRKNDRAWLDQHLPSSRNVPRATHPARQPSALR